MIYISQDAIDIGLKWYPYDPINLQWRVADNNWSGNYVAKLRQYPDTDSTELATFTLTAVYDVINLWTTFTLTLANNTVDVGNYWWACKQDNGITRFSGAVIVSV